MIEGMVMLAVVAGVTLFFGIVWLYVDFSTWIVSGERNFDRDWPMPLPLDGLSIYLLNFACVTAYLYSTMRKKLGPALLEILVNLLLPVAVLIITLIGMAENDWLCWVCCIIPLYMLAIMTLAANYRLARDGIRDGLPDGSPDGAPDESPP
jgi:hypothetical protein